MNDQNKISLLTLGVVIIVFMVIVLILALIIIIIKEKKKEKQEKLEKEGASGANKEVKKSEIQYKAESIFDFMNFEKIEDNMIIKKNGEFLMVIECKGINYDLMSEMEKASVEQGFTSFLNTLRNPIQIYIQTRTINFEDSIIKYKERLKDIDKKYFENQIKYENLIKGGVSTKDEIDRAKYELVKQKNLREYTDDIIKHIEMQSLNQNILSKRYYIVIPCYRSEIEAGFFDNKEVKNIVFSQLYTRARAVINSLYACQVTAKILNSEELTELLYIAYNRDEADSFPMEKIKKAGLDDLYTTAPDVLEKKIKILDKEIENKAMEMANDVVSVAKREKEIEIMEKEKNEKELIEEKAKNIIKKHRKYIGEEIANNAIDLIDKNNTRKIRQNELEDNKEKRKYSKRKENNKIQDEKNNEININSDKVKNNDTNINTEKDINNETNNKIDEETKGKKLRRKS